MYRAYRFRLYPNTSQKLLIKKTFGCYRLVYNYFLDKCKTSGNIKAFVMCKELKEMYSTYPWLKEVDSCSLRCAIFNLEDAYKNFFDKRSNYPTFKNKFSRQSYRTNCIRSIYKGKDYSNIELDLVNKKIKLPKLGLVDIRGYRNLRAIDKRIINATVIKEPTGKYYVSVIVDEKEIKEERVIPRNIVGIDLGIKYLVITSNGEKYSNPRVINSFEKRLKRLQRKLSRQIKDSNNFLKTKEKLGRIHSKIKNARKHNIVKIVNKLIKDNDIIVTEKLKVKEMLNNHRLAKLVGEVSFNKICEVLKRKSKLKGKYYYQVDTYYPSSKTYNVCGEKTEITNNLNIRSWECKSYGSYHDRDINASINIMFEGIRLHYGKI